MPVHVFTGILTLIVVGMAVAGTSMLIVAEESGEVQPYLKFATFLGYSLAV